MKIKEALLQAQIWLDKDYKQAEFFLCEYLQKDKTWLFLNGGAEFDEKPYFELIKRFLQGEPFEYIFEKASFYGLDFKIQKGVLIPRFDTEILLELCLKELQANSYKNILEIGFGSGILSIILALKLQKKIIACDISQKALKIAKENAKNFKVLDLIDFRLCDFKSLKEDFDFIFSNPPYIAYDYPLDIWVQNEPSEALFGGVEGFEFLAQIIAFASLKKAKVLACEFAYNQASILKKILDENGFEALFVKDTSSFDRAFLAHKKNL